MKVDIEKVISDIVLAKNLYSQDSDSLNSKNEYRQKIDEARAILTKVSQELEKLTILNNEMNKWIERLKKRAITKFRKTLAPSENDLFSDYPAYIGYQPESASNIININGVFLAEQLRALADHMEKCSNGNQNNPS